MAKLMKCKDCNQDISKKAKFCPKCGAPVKKKTSILTWLVLMLFVPFLYLIFTTPTSHQPINNKKIQLTEEEKQEIEIEAKRRAQISFESETIYKAQKMVKKSLKDPSSAEFKNVFFNETEKVGGVACGTVNSKNSFGAYTGFQRFVASSNTVFLQEKDSNFPEVWKAACEK